MEMSSMFRQIDLKERIHEIEKKGETKKERERAAS